MTPVYGYTRVSGPSQMQGHGPDRQRELIQDFARRSGLEIVRWFDESHTGTEADRPALVEMLGEMVESGVRIVVVESLDRFSRDLMVQCALLSKLASENIDLIAANTGENVTQAMRDDPMRRALVQIQGVFAELDRNLLVRKLRLGKQAKIAAGLIRDGKPPYGMMAGELEIALRIKKLRRYQGLSYGKIAKVLNRDLVPTRGGGPWMASTVQAICKRKMVQIEAAETPVP